MRLISEISNKTAYFVKKCVEWKIDDEYDSEKNYISNFINFLKLRMFSKNKIVRQVFEDFEVNPNDKKIEGMFLVCLEIAMYEKSILRIDLDKIIRTLENIEKKHIEKSKEEKEQVKKVLKSDKKRSFLVYWEFDKTSEYALEHALKISENLNTEITLVHFARKGPEHINAIKKLRILIQDIDKKYNKKIHAKIIDKSKDILLALEAATDVQAEFVFIGTAGFTKKLNIISSSHIPFVVVQSPPKKEVIKNVIFPVDSRVEIKSKLNIASKLSEMYDLQYHICMPGKFSVAEIKTKTIRNFNFAKSYFDQNNIKQQSAVISETKSPAEATNIYAKKINGDLIIVLPRESIELGGFVMSADEKSIIKNNPGIPILFATTKISSTHGFGLGVLY